MLYFCTSCQVDTLNPQRASLNLRTLPGIELVPKTACLETGQTVSMPKGMRLQLHMFTYGAGDGTQVRAKASRKWEVLGI